MKEIKNYKSSLNS